MTTLIDSGRSSTSSPAPTSSPSPGETTGETTGRTSPSPREIVAGLSPEERARLARALTPRLTSYIPHVPHPAQTAFLLLDVREAFYGGAAGGGKSDALLMGALQYADVPGYSALILRRSFTDLALPGAIMERAGQWLRPTDARKSGDKTWVFPSGAKLTFGYLAHESDKYQYQSAEFQYVAFDELTQFTKSQYEYLFSRLRRPSDLDEMGAAPDGTTLADVPLRMRSASNPGGPGHVWVRTDLVDVETRKPGTVFIPARLRDNPSLDADSYEDSLGHLDIVERERLKKGDWEIADAGVMFQRQWFPIVPQGPLHGVRRVLRHWDMASTEVKRGTDPDWTAGALLTLVDGQWFLLDMIRKQLTPHGVERLIAQTAVADRARFGGKLAIRMEQEPGSSGKTVIDMYKRKVLPGFDFDGNRPTGSKSERARPMASAAEAGNFILVEGAWNRDFLDEAEAFPTGPHDDMIDACSGAMQRFEGGARLIA